MLKRLLAHPATRGLDLDDPGTTTLRRRVVREKGFLRRLYQEWYRAIAASLPPVPGPVVEVGSGAGFLADHVPGLVTSDVLAVEGIDLVLDAARLPFGDGRLRALVMTNVLHHLAHVESFLEEAARCLRAGGAIVMVEPWVTGWSRAVYHRLHHEAFEPDRPGWDVMGTGPLSGANGALPWILFQRDRARLEERFPEWRVREIRPLMPLSYLLSGGVSLRSLVPGWSFGAVRALERISGLEARGAMFALVVLTREGR